jgi:transcription antitermination factor NusG
VENLHPSEDGEALRRIARMSSQVDCSFIPVGESEASAASRWFAVYTACRHEKRVAQHFGQREIQHYLPLYRAERKWSDGSRVTLDLPLFPGYLFVYINRSERVRVLNVPGALAVVDGTGREPAPLPDAAIDALRLGLEEHHVEPHPLLTIGQQVRIRSGAFAGMEGVVIRKKNGLRVVLTLQQIMQSIAVEVDEDDLEQMEASSPNPVRISDLTSALCLQRT